MNAPLLLAQLVLAGRPLGGKIHAVPMGPGLVPAGEALCGTKTTSGADRWVEVDGPEVPTCWTCRARAEGQK